MSSTTNTYYLLQFNDANPGEPENWTPLNDAPVSEFEGVDARSDMALWELYLAYLRASRKKAYRLVEVYTTRSEKVIL